MGGTFSFDLSSGAAIGPQQPQPAVATPAPSATPAPVSRWTTIDEEEEKQSMPQVCVYAHVRGCMLVQVSVCLRACVCASCVHLCA